MKKLTFLIAIFLLPALAMAQTANIDNLMKKYGGQEGVTVVNISPQLFQVMSELDVKEFSGQDFPLDKLSAVKIITIENAALLKGTNFYKEVTADLDLARFAEIMTVKDGAEDVRMWMNNEGKQIREFLLLVSSPDEGVVVYISGDFNMKDIGGLAQSFNGMEGLEALENMKNN
ncbi:MAG: DUF4252 domain-containing protein [Bacteroidales bacterium]